MVDKSTNYKKASDYLITLMAEGKVFMNNTQELWRYLSIVHRCSQKFVGRSLSPFGIKASEYPFFIILSRKDGLSQHDLSELSGVDEAQTVRVMRTLEEKGFIMRERASYDKRVILVSLTDEGKKLQPVIDEALKQWHTAVTGSASSQDVESICRFMAEFAGRSWKLVNQEEFKEEV